MGSTPSSLETPSLESCCNNYFSSSSLPPSSSSSASTAASATPPSPSPSLCPFHSECSTLFWISPSSLALSDCLRHLPPLKGDPQVVTNVLESCKLLAQQYVQNRQEHSTLASVSSSATSSSSSSSSYSSFLQSSASPSTSSSSPNSRPASTNHSYALPAVATQLPLPPHLALSSSSTSSTSSSPFLSSSACSSTVPCEFPTVDEVVSIAFYAEGVGIWQLVNDHIRHYEDNQLKLFYPLLRLMLNGLRKLPTSPATLYYSIDFGPADSSEAAAKKLNLLRWYQAKLNSSLVLYEMPVLSTVLPFPNNKHHTIVFQLRSLSTSSFAALFPPNSMANGKTNSYCNFASKRVLWLGTRVEIKAAEECGENTCRVDLEEREKPLLLQRWESYERKKKETQLIETHTDSSSTSASTSTSSSNMLLSSLSLSSHSASASSSSASTASSVARLPQDGYDAEELKKPSVYWPAVAAEQFATISSSAACANSSTGLQPLETQTLKLLDSTIRLDVISTSPRVLLLHSFLSPCECDEIIRLAEPRLRRSGVGVSLDLAKGLEQTSVSNRRTSSTAGFPRSSHPLISKIEKLLMSIVGTPLENIEPLQVVSYTPGQYYKAHYDTKPADALNAMDGGLRMHTLLVYLTDGPSDLSGCTYFPHLGMRIRPTKGMAVWWRNVLINPNTKQPSVDARMLHAGEPPTSGKKYALNCWIRQSEFVIHPALNPAKAAAAQAASEKSKLAPLPSVEHFTKDDKDSMVLTSPSAKSALSHAMFFAATGNPSSAKLSTQTNLDEASMNRTVPMSVETVHVAAANGKVGGRKRHAEVTS